MRNRLNQIKSGIWILMYTTLTNLEVGSSMDQGPIHTMMKPIPGTKVNGKTTHKISLADVSNPLKSLICETKHKNTKE